MRIKPSFSLCPGTVLDVSPVDMPAVASAAGYDATGVRFPPDSSPLHLAPRIAAEGERVGVPVSDVEIARIRPDTDLRYVEDLVAAAALLGARHVLTVVDVDGEEALDALVHLGRVAQRCGVVLGLEFMPFSRVPTAVLALELVQKVGDPSVRVILDALHLHRTRGQVSDIPADLVCCVQLCDAGPDEPRDVDGLAAEARHRRLLPGQGVIDLAPLIEIGPLDVPFGVEVQSDLLLQERSAIDRARLALHASRVVVDGLLMTSREETL